MFKCQGNTTPYVIAFEKTFARGDFLIEPLMWAIAHSKRFSWKIVKIQKLIADPNSLNTSIIQQIRWNVTHCWKQLTVKLHFEFNANKNCNQLFRRQSEFGQTSKQHATYQFNFISPALAISINVACLHRMAEPLIASILSESIKLLFVWNTVHHQIADFILVIRIANVQCNDRQKEKITNSNMLKISIHADSRLLQTYFSRVSPAENTPLWMDILVHTFRRAAVELKPTTQTATINTHIDGSICTSI